jgi:hypothetical protein
VKEEEDEEEERKEKYLQHKHGVFGRGQGKEPDLV